MGAPVKTAEQPPQDATAETIDALLEAARYDDIDDLMSIASSGVSLDSKDSEGRTGFRLFPLSSDFVCSCIATALHMASANGHLDIVDYLVRNGVMEVLDDNIYLGTVTARSCLKLSVITWKMVVDGNEKDANLDVNACNVEKNTPLHWASLNGHIEVVKRLILSGAEISPLNSHEKSPIDEALSRGKLDVIDAINEVAAQVDLARTQVS
ncbi:hypothetical protein SASPL_137289 [Salvia splendens]|uniref:26S proteasome non-ATPase regulatory subunit 10 n=1 Tax=Salvia splendens TaxID=180675 RepID=A0A8X8ZD99_SALSN|nr:hypothetical protein SASPL_137289 [Salvia splendens]